MGEVHVSAARSQPGPSGSGFRLERLALESFGSAVEVADGFWVLATRHHPGHAKNRYAINDRCLLFRVDDGRGPSLVVVNAVDPQIIPEVQRVATMTRLPVRTIVSPGGGRHVS